MAQLYRVTTQGVAAGIRQVHGGAFAFPKVGDIIALTPAAADHMLSIGAVEPAQKDAVLTPPRFPRGVRPSYDDATPKKRARKERAE